MTISPPSSPAVASVATAPTATTNVLTLSCQERPGIMQAVTSFLYDRGFDILELQPSDQLSKNEIEAAKLVRFAEYNPQSQPKIEWPAAFPVVRSYLDQLVRGNGLGAERTAAIASALDAAEQQNGKSRRDALNALAKQVDKDVEGAKDPERVKTMSAAISPIRSFRKFRQNFHPGFSVSKFDLTT